MIQSLTSNPRFGWAKQGHELINQGAYDLLRTNPEAQNLTQFVEQHQGVIEKYCRLQDQSSRDSSGHFLDMESIWEGNGSTRLSWKERKFEEVSSFFDSGNRKKYLSSFNQKQGGSPVFKEFPVDYRQKNVYQSLIRAYDKLVFQLETPNIQSKDLQKTLGELAHYVGDIHQPLHTSKFYDWKALNWGKSKNAHHFFEHNLKMGQDIGKWYQSIKKDLLAESLLFESLNPAEIRKNLKNVLKAGYESMFQIVAVDREARLEHEKTKGSFGNYNRYIENLKSGWRPIAEERMKEASQLLALLLYSAYKSANHPELRFSARA